ncbi:MAG TPA: peptidoglycan-binding domain-containing protein, partial [Gammaproteobacteria bacterium]
VATAEASAAPPATPIAPAGIAPQETPLPQGVGDLAQAERALLDLWGLERSDSEAGLCVTAARHGLECLRSRGDWDNLLHYNRPALLTLNREGEARYVLLETLDGQNATLRSEGASVTLPRAALDHYWRGEFRLLWRPHPLVLKTIGPFSSEQAVRWLGEALDRFEGRESREEVYRFDERMVERIRRLQRRQGLVVDGIAGPRTLSHLHAPYDTSPGPRLHDRQSVS